MTRIVVVSASVNSPLEDWDIAERIRDFVESEFPDVTSVTITILNDIETITFARGNEKPNEEIRIVEQN